MTNLRTITACATAVATAACIGETEPACDPAATTCALATAFAPVALAAGDELDSLCVTWDLGNDTALWVNAVEFDNDGFYHHSNWFFVPEDAVDAAPVPTECDAIGFEEITAAVQGGVLFAQSTQNTAETQAFVPGAAIRIPPHARVVGNLHVLNLSDQSIETGARMTLRTLPEADVTAVLAPFRIEYNDLHIPPNAESTFGVTCDIGDYLPRLTGEPLDMRIHYVLPHVHDLATGFEARALSPNGSVEVYSSGGFAPGGWGKTLEPPLAIGGATGLSSLRMTCTYRNPRDEEVAWGIGDQEMCVLFGFAESSVQFEGRVRFGDGVRVGPDPTGTVHHEGACSLVGSPLPE